MALADAVVGALRPSQSITWTRADGSAEDLTGATITATIKRAGTSSAVAATGTFTVTDGENGVFKWEYSAADVSVAGTHNVQFSAAFGSGLTPAKTFVDSWTVRRSLT